MDPPPKGVDEGPALLEPIGDDEYRAIEKVLSLLWDAATSARLTEAQERKIRSIAELIADEHREAVPGETARYALVAIVRRGVKGFMSGDDALKNALAWSQLAQITYGMGWHTIEALARAAGG